METGAITSYIDVAQVVLYVFWAFFAGLLFYLRREDRREGYPLLSEVDGRPMNHGIYMPEPKSFRLSDGSTVKAPSGKVDDRVIKAKPLEPWSGAPLEPTGDPMLSEFGPGAYAQRADVPDKTLHGTPRLAPLRLSGGFYVAAEDEDPRGMQVLGADGRPAGQVSDVWVDRSETLIRYLEVDVGPSTEPRRVLLPINFAKIDRARRVVRVDAILARHFANVPQQKNADVVTLLEEEKICAYFGGGTLYADPMRRETLL